MPPIIAMKLFNSLVLPILSYSCEIWFPIICKTLRANLNVFQMRHFKSVLNVKQSTSNWCVYGDLGEYPLHIKIICKTIRYWMRLVNISSDHIVKKMYHELETLHGMGHSNWVTHIKDILDETDLNYLWEHGTPSLKLTKHIRGH